MTDRPDSVAQTAAPADGAGTSEPEPRHAAAASAFPAASALPARPALPTDPAPATGRGERAAAAGRDTESAARAQRGPFEVRGAVARSGESPGGSVAGQDGPDGPAGQDDRADRGEVRDSFAELAAVAAGVDIPSDAGESGSALARSDDHAFDVGDAAEPTRAPLLLHSLSDLREIWVPLIQASGARSVAEIGSESGVTTSLLVDLLRRGGGGRLLVVDPDPGVAPASGGGLDVQVVRGYSPQALDGHVPTDAYLIDGDHNYTTVHGELTEIDRAVARFGRSYFPMVILHDVGWPAGRRDQYYNPDRIPQDARQPHSWDVGVEIDNGATVPGGFRGMGAFAWALTEGGPRNGVRTAIEDFVADHPDLRFFTVAPIFGLGVVIDRRAPWARRIADLLAPWVSNRLLSRMERNRIDLYLHVLRLQDTAAAVARARQREWARLDDERSRLAALELEHLHRIGELEEEVARHRRQEDERARSAAAAGAGGTRLVQVARIANSMLRSRLGPTGQDRLTRMQARVTDSGAGGRSTLPALRRRPASPAPSGPPAPRPPRQS